MRHTTVVRAAWCLAQETTGDHEQEWALTPFELVRISRADFFMLHGTHSIPGNAEALVSLPQYCNCSTAAQMCEQQVSWLYGVLSAA